jgi:hypothetical protein
MNYTFEKHVLHVNGAFSKISTKQQNNLKYELYYGNHEERFNKGLELLLQCVGGFMDKVG